MTGSGASRSTTEAPRARCTPGIPLQLCQLLLNTALSNFLFFRLWLCHNALLWRADDSEDTGSSLSAATPGGTATPRAPTCQSNPLVSRSHDDDGGDCSGGCGGDDHDV
eukprot:269068-Rhodomonas_salina.1